MCDKSVTEKINCIEKQFLIAIPMSRFNWKDIFEDIRVNPEIQVTLINKTTNSELVKQYPICNTYQKAFLKELLKKVKETDIEDVVYSQYGRLVSLPLQTEYFRHYLMNSGGHITLKESPNLISEGTTGLRTWEASMVLSEWALQNKDNFSQNVILELGSGAGLTGIVISKDCSPKSLYLTDCHNRVLENLCENIKINIKEGSADGARKFENNRCLFRNLGPPELAVLNLAWQDINEAVCAEIGNVDKVIAADIVFDADLFDDLVGAMKNLAEFSSVKEFIFSCTERDPETLRTFLEQIDKNGFGVNDLQVPEQKDFLWPTDTPIKMFSFVR